MLHTPCPSQTLLLDPQHQVGLQRPLLLALQPSQPLPACRGPSCSGMVLCLFYGVQQDPPEVWQRGDECGAAVGLSRQWDSLSFLAE